jgi:beta-carotene 3-hydroxylase
MQAGLATCGRKAHGQTMDWGLPLAIVLITIAAMEWAAWASPKYIPDGFGWAWHRDHHELHD